MKYYRKTTKESGMKLKENKGMELGREILIPIKENKIEGDKK